MTPSRTPRDPIRPGRPVDDDGRAGGTQPARPWADRAGQAAATRSSRPATTGVEEAGDDGTDDGGHDEDPQLADRRAAGE